MDDTQTSRDEDLSPGCSSVHQKGSEEPETSCVSMRSDKSLDLLIEFKSGDTQSDLSSFHHKKSEPEPSCVSMRSEGFMSPPLHPKSGDTQTDLRYNISVKDMI
ncbi:hypothetical protein cypCar_00042546 [Cyprinus carpio]|nr:hypothetical protein cypCar_00042546 [Cyprinus carpio]